MAVRRDQVQDSELFPELVDILVEGWAGNYAWPNPSDRALDAWQFRDEDLRAVWRRNKVELHAEAVRRGLTLPWCERYYDFDPPAWLREGGAAHDVE